MAPTKAELQAFRRRWGAWFWLTHQGLLVVAFIAVLVCLFRRGTGWEITLLLVVLAVLFAWSGKKSQAKYQELYIDYFVSRGISGARALRYWEKENVD